MVVAGTIVLLVAGLIFAARRAHRWVPAQWATVGYVVEEHVSFDPPIQKD